MLFSSSTRTAGRTRGRTVLLIALLLAVIVAVVLFLRAPTPPSQALPVVTTTRRPADLRPVDVRPGPCPPGADLRRPLEGLWWPLCDPIKNEGDAPRVNEVDVAVLAGKWHAL